MPTFGGPSCCVWSLGEAALPVTQNVPHSCPHSSSCDAGHKNQLSQSEASPDPLAVFTFHSYTRTCLRHPANQQVVVTNFFLFSQSTLPRSPPLRGLLMFMRSEITWLLLEGHLVTGKCLFPAQPAQVGQGGSAFAPQLSHPPPIRTLPISLFLSGKVCQMKSYFSGLTKDELTFLPLVMTVVGLRP